MHNISESLELESPSGHAKLALTKVRNIAPALAKNGTTYDEGSEVTGGVGGRAGHTASGECFECLENVNVVADPANARLVRALSSQLRQAWA